MTAKFVSGDLPIDQQKSITDDIYFVDIRKHMRILTLWFGLIYLNRPCFWTLTLMNRILSTYK